MRRKHAALQDIRDIVEKKLAQMLATESAADGLLQEVSGDRRRLQPREGPHHGRRDICAARSNWPTASTPSRSALPRRASATTNWHCSTCCSKRTSAKPTGRGLSRQARICLRHCKSYSATYRIGQEERNRGRSRGLHHRYALPGTPRPPFSVEETDAIAAKVFDFVRQRNASAGESLSA